MGSPILPLGNRLGGHAEQLRERFLRQILLHAQPSDRLSHCACGFFASVHDILSSFLKNQRGACAVIIVYHIRRQRRSDTSATRGTTERWNGTHDGGS